MTHDPSDGEPSGGTMGPTSAAALTVWAAAGLVGGWLLRPVAERTQGTAPIVNWLQPLALLFVAAVSVHLLRVFFTGAFRRPRELNWVIGTGLLTLAILEGFAGYSLPDDLLSGVGLRIMSAIIIGLPIIGTWLHWIMFAGDFPGDIIIPRLYIAHVLLAGYWLWIVLSATPQLRRGARDQQVRRRVLLIKTAAVGLTALVVGVIHFWATHWWHVLVVLPVAAGLGLLLRRAYRRLVAPPRHRRPLTQRARRFERGQNPIG